jgi:argininosuccinate lyase
VAERLVGAGMPFRQAHEIAGGLVGRAIREGRSLSEVVREEANMGDFGDLFARGAALVNRRSAGGSGPDAADVQKARLRHLVSSLAEKL